MPRWFQAIFFSALLHAPPACASITRSAPLFAVAVLTQPVNTPPGELGIAARAASVPGTIAATATTSEMLRSVRPRRVLRLTFPPIVLPPIFPPLREHVPARARIVSIHSCSHDSRSALAATGRR